MPPITPPTSRRWRKACRCLLRRATRGGKLRSGILPWRTHGIGVSSFASTPYNVAVGGTDFADTSQHTNGTYWGPSNSADLRFGPLLHSGDPLERFLRRAPSWRSFRAIRLVMAPPAIVEAAWRSNPEHSSRWPAAADQAAALPALRRKTLWWAAVARDTPNLPGKPECPAFRTMASAIFPMSRSSPPTDCGATITCSAFPILPMAARRAKARRPIGRARGGTSFSSPIMAGIQALVNQKMGGATG